LRLCRRAPMKPTAALLIVALALLLSACSESDLTREAHPTTLVGSAWRVVAVNGRPPVAGSEPTAVFAATDVKGSSGCNSYGGQYAYDPSSGAISFRDLAMTAMACIEPGRNDFEGIFTPAINQATSASIDPEGRLVLSGPGGEIVLAVDAIPQ
jgi:heat shock protein HslJ